MRCTQVAPESVLIETPSPPSTSRFDASFGSITTFGTTGPRGSTGSTVELTPPFVLFVIRVSECAT